ncbi:MAG TPA: tetratricopeptide repeat protein, partial [Longimicrobiaceae bacterium]
APEVEPLAGLDLPLVGNEVDSGIAMPPEGLETVGLEGLETMETGLDFTAPAGGAEEDDGLPFLDPGFEIEHTSLADEEPAPAELPLLYPADGAPEMDVEEAGDEDEEDEEEEGEPLPLLDFDAVPEPPVLPPFAGRGAAPAWSPPPARDAVEELRERVAAAPHDTASLHRLVDLLEDRGRAAEAETVLVEAHRALGAGGRYPQAIEAVRSLLARRPDDTALYQKQVEYAFRAGDAESMVRAYLDLGRHLGPPADNAKSRAVYQRVLELDAGNEEARRALAPPPPPEPVPAPRQSAPAGDYVDLGSLIMEDEPEERSTRFVVEEEEPTGDEDRDFADMLSVFRQKVNENIGADDPSSHYDLGVAFMEMGLVDEAIAEFQVALRGGANPLATLEMLGSCFVEKGQHAVAARVLDRALRIPGASEAEVVGVVYQLGRCQEALGNAAAAREMYERVLAFDIRFRDAASRLESLRAVSGTGF